MNESEVKSNLIVKPMKKAGYYARRIEDAYSVGFPDLILKLPRFAWVFAEVKLVKGNFYEPSPRQRIELQRLDEAGDCWPVVIGYSQEIKRWHFSLVKQRIIVTDESTFSSMLDFPTALDKYLRWETERSH